MDFSHDAGTRNTGARPHSTRCEARVSGVQPALRSVRLLAQESRNVVALSTPDWRNRLNLSGIAVVDDGSPPACSRCAVIHIPARLPSPPWLSVPVFCDTTIMGLLTGADAASGLPRPVATMVTRRPSSIAVVVHRADRSPSPIVGGKRLRMVFHDRHDISCSWRLSTCSPKC